MLDLAAGWVSAVDRGPGWLFVRITRPEADHHHGPSLKECLWSLLEEHFTYRLVLEMDEIDKLDRVLVDQLLSLSEEIAGHGGVLKLCGLSARNRKAIQRRHLETRLPSYGSRMDAVLCRAGAVLPNRPR